MMTNKKKWIADGKTKTENAKVDPETQDQSILSLPKLQRALGQDYVYVSASDIQQRHFDSEIVIGAFLLHLLASAVKGAMTEFAGQAGKAAWSTTLSLFHKLKQSDFSDHSSQVEGIKSSDEGLRSLSAELYGSEAEDFVESIRGQLEKGLVAHHFPKPNAKRLAGEIAAILKQRVTHGR